MNLRITLSAFAMAALTACATTALDPAAANVKPISAAQAKSCEFVGAISAANMNTLAKDPKLDATNRAYNDVASAGGNSLLITDTDLQGSASGIGGTYSITGEAYKCAG